MRIRLLSASVLFLLLGCFYPDSGRSNPYDPQSAVYQPGAFWTPLTPTPMFAPRYNYAMCAFNGKLWVYGGDNNSPQIYSAHDGMQWKSGGTYPFAARNSFKVIPYNGKLWVVAGNATNGITNDVWNSSDGVTWNFLTFTPGFTNKAGYGALVFNNRLWVIAGEKLAPTYTNDVWSTVDGMTWTAHTTSAPFAPRRDFGAVAFNNRIWVVGGLTNTGSGTNDVWSSADGANWSLANPNAPFGRRWSFSLTVHNGYMILIGGTTNTSMSAFSDVWKSKDGTNWSLVTNNVFAARYGHSTVSFNDRLILGPGTNSGPPVNEILSAY